MFCTLLGLVVASAQREILIGWRITTLRPSAKRRSVATGSLPQRRERRKTVRDL
jgi:hypothetical protein